MMNDEEQYSERFEIYVILRYIFLLEVNIFSCSFDSKGQYGTFFFRPDNAILSVMIST
jgi:hypothetical protein